MEKKEIIKESVENHEGTFGVEQIAESTGLPEMYVNFYFAELLEEEVIFRVGDYEFRTKEVKYFAWFV